MKLESGAARHLPAACELCEGLAPWLHSTHRHRRVSVAVLPCPSGHGSGQPHRLTCPGLHPAQRAGQPKRHCIRSCHQIALCCRGGTAGPCGCHEPDMCCAASTAATCTGHGMPRHPCAAISCPAISCHAHCALPCKLALAMPCTPCNAYPMRALPPCAHGMTVRSMTRHAAFSCHCHAGCTPCCFTPRAA